MGIIRTYIIVDLSKLISPAPIDSPNLEDYNHSTIQSSEGNLGSESGSSVKGITTLRSDTLRLIKKHRHFPDIGPYLGNQRRRIGSHYFSQVSPEKGTIDDILNTDTFTIPCVGTRFQ